MSFNNNAKQGLRLQRLHPNELYKNIVVPQIKKTAAKYYHSTNGSGAYICDWFNTSNQFVNHVTQDVQKRYKTTEGLIVNYLNMTQKGLNNEIIVASENSNVEKVFMNKLKNAVTNKVTRDIKQMTKHCIPVDLYNMIRVVKMNQNDGNINNSINNMKEFMSLGANTNVEDITNQYNNLKRVYNNKNLRNKRYKNKILKTIEDRRNFLINLKV